MNGLQKIFNLTKWIVIGVVIALLVYFGNILTCEYFVQLFEESPAYVIIYLITWGIFLLLVYLYEKILKSPVY